MRDSAQLFRMVLQALRASGADVDAVIGRLGGAAALNAPDGRIAHALQQRFWEAVEAVTGDPDIGLHLCPFLPPYRGEILEYLMFSSQTLGEGAMRGLKYLRLVSDALRMQFATDAQTVRLRLLASALDTPQARHTEILVTHGTIRFVGDAADGQVRPRAVHLRWPPLAPEADYRAVFGCAVGFGGDTNLIEWDAESFQYRSPRWDPELVKLHEQLARRRLAALERSDRVDEVRRALARRLEGGACELADVARDLGVTPRRLRIDLAQAGTSFSQLLDDYRATLAQRLLAESDERIEDIAYLTGFSEPSTFYRAFRRWCGVTPAHYRERHRKPPDRR